MIFFIVFVLFCMKYVWPPITQAMKERAEKIADGLAAADRAEQDLEMAQQRATDQLKEAKAEGAKIIEQARKRGDQMVDEAKLKAQEEAERIRLAAESEVEQQVARAREELRTQLAALTVTGAERILGEAIDASKHSEMLDKLAAEL